ncbi:MAG: energy-coupling factor transporter transmembrane protein EcfT [Lachnospiraceae bacterium]|nr:energy-coupling factor transporter transmembrane protein EcfT [Lachnospiraceae bacterium]MBR1670433.1 energy-coupling factor transporter transmembrane protein EcfT [Butyrivibrio sp.]
MNLLNYVPGDSFLHRLNPVTKLAAAFMYGIAAILCENVFAEALFIVVMILISATAGLFKRAVLLTGNLMILGLIMFVIQLLFVRDGSPLLVIGGVVLFTTGGLKSALLLSLRVIAAMLPLMLLFAITRMNDLCNALVKRLHLPYRYAFIVTTAFRFVPIFATEFHDIQDAQKARGVDFDTRNIFRKLGLIAPLCVPLLVSSLKKVDVSAMSAEMRGFELRGYKSGYKEYPFAARDMVTVLVLVVLIVATVVLKTIPK